MTDRRTDGRTDRRTDRRTDGGDCNIPDAFLKKRGDNNIVLNQTRGKRIVHRLVCFFDHFYWS